MSAQTPADGGIQAERAQADPASADRAPADRAPADRGQAARAQAERAPVVRILLITAVCVGIAALAVAAFVLSYSAIHAFAQHAGVPARLARAVPVMVDAMLVVALAATLALRGAGLPSRLLAWVILLAVLAAAAGADALRADGRTLPHHAAALTVAIVPWALVLLAFVLLLAMLRYGRLRRQAAGSGRRALAAASVGSDLGTVPGYTAPGYTAPDYAATPGYTGVPSYTGIPAQAGPSKPAPLELLPRPAQTALAYTSPEPVSTGVAEAASPPEAAIHQTAQHQTAQHQTAQHQTARQQTAPELEQASESPMSDSLWDRLAGPRWEAPEPYQQSAAPDDAGLARDDAGLAADSQPSPLGSGHSEAPDQLPAESAEQDTPAHDAGAHDAGAHDAGAHDAPAQDVFSPAPTDADDHQDPDMPVFHRLWSSPTPPVEQS
jgi:Protein of unknown function (DUF2637)